jgi:hypothetical protein
VKVGTVWDHVTDVDAQTEANPPIWRLVAVIHRHLLLHFDRAAHRAVDAVKSDEQGIPASLYDPTAVLANGWIDQRSPQAPQATEGTSVIQADQAGIVDHVGANYGD